jgi:SecD/SecF fusion protein
MKKHKYRTLLIYAAIVIAVINIYPTIGWVTLSEEARAVRMAQWKAEDEARLRIQPGLFTEMGWGIKRWSEFDRERVINLGLDLQGGLHMIVGFNDPEDAEEREVDVQQLVLQRIRNRINDLEAKEPIIQTLGSNQIQIQLPGEKDVTRAKKIILNTAFLGFHMASGPQEALQTWIKIDDATDNGFIPFLHESPLDGTIKVSEGNLARVKQIALDAEAAGHVPEGKKIAFSTPPAAWETDRDYELYLIDAVESLSGEGLRLAVARPDPQRPGRSKILFEFGGEAVQTFGELTANNIGRNMAIVLDGGVVSAPTINERIAGSGEITGEFSPAEATDLAISLNSGSMPVPLFEEYSGVVGPSLGADSVSRGVQSSIIGLVFVMAFMLVYYRAGGIIANISLGINALFVLAAFGYFNATLTLPGIAGLILTIGMAVDANVLIFERIREELLNGKSLGSAVEGGFARATSAILDANVTTLIAAAVLSQFGTGPVQGFAVALSIGVCASVFAALVISRSLLDLVVDRKLMSNLTMMRLLKGTPTFHFLEKRRLAATLSAVAILIGGTMFVVRGKENFGVDFTNGTSLNLTIASAMPIPVGDVRQKLIDAGFDSPTVMESAETDLSAGNTFLVRVGDVSERDEGATDPESMDRSSVTVRVQELLAPLADNSDVLDEAVIIEREEMVGPAVGAQLRTDAFLAISYALILIVMYLWYRFELKFAVGAVVALVHDVLIVVGLFALTGREISIPVVAALLTIIGYSLNDTIVVFDRVREDLHIYRTKNMTFLEILNVSVNQTLSRTLLTSLTTMFVVLVLFVYGGSAINDFAFALIAGVMVGTYSSIFVASPVVYLLEMRRGKLGIGSASDERGGSRRRNPKPS